MGVGEFSIGPQSNAVSRPLIESFNFRLVIDKLGDINFARVSALTTTMSVNAYREGGSMLSIKDPDMVEFADITCERGVSYSELIYEWVLSVTQDIMGDVQGMPTFIKKRNATLYEYTRDKQVAKRIQLYGLFPTSFTAGEWDNGQDQVLIEKLTLAYDYFEIIS